MLRMMRAFSILVVRPTVLSLLIAIAISGPAFAQSTVSAGGSFTLVVKSDSTVWSFGWNQNGQLGLGSLGTQTWPQQIPGLTGIQAVAAGGLHAVALTTSGNVYAWGGNFFNQVDGSNVDQTTPVLLQGLSNVIVIAAGEYHSLALTSEGKVYAWGRNGYGQSGGPTSDNVTSPTIVIDGGVVAIGAGGNHSLAVMSDGSVLAWGANTVGQLGNGTTSTAGNATPSTVLNVSGAIAVDAGEEHSLFLLNDGTVKAVGENGAGQLGDTFTLDQSTPVVVDGLTDVTMIAAGADHSFALKNDGSAWGWGHGLQLGNGHDPNALSPVAITALSAVTAIAGDSHHSLAVTTNGTVFTWGSANGSGEQGDGSTIGHYAATAISGANYDWNVATPVITPAGGGFSSNQTAAITTATSGATIHYTTNGTEPSETDPTYSTEFLIDHSLTVKARAWKSGMPTSGVATSTFVLTATQPTVSPAATTYTTPQTVTFSTTTSGATIYYTTDGSTPTESSTLYTAPLQVATTTTFKIAAFKAGWSSSSVRTATYAMNFGALTAPTLDPATGAFTGSVSVTMSSPESGATIRYTTNNTAPTATSAIYTSAITVGTTTTVRAKVFHPDYGTSPETSRTYTLTTHTPTLSRPAGSYAPGSTVTVTAGVPTDTLRMTIDGSDPTTTSPTIASGTTVFVGNFTLKVKAWRTGAIDSAIASAAYTVTGPLGPGSAAAGGTHSVIATPDGRVIAWGENGNGQLGLASTSDKTTPTTLNTITGVTQIAAGLAHTLARTWDGQLYAWGSNGSGRLGDGTTTQRTTPTPITTLSNVIAIAAGDAHSLALTSDGHLYSWGLNSSGELGLGNTTATSTPTLIPTLSNIVAIAAGDSHSFAVTSSGELYAWGNDGSSRLGDGGTTNRLSPVLINLPNVVSVAAGASHSLAMTSSGAVYSWGLGSNGQLGRGTTSSASTPTLVPSLHVSAIAAGDNFSAAIRSDGVLVAWGLNSSGQIGDSSPTQRTAPVIVGGPASISNVAYGDAFAMAVTPTGEVWTWGAGASGQLGDGGISNRNTPQAVVSGANAIASWAPAAPIVSAPSQTFASAQTVTISSSTPDAVIRYNLTGAEPSESDAAVPANGELLIDYSSLLRAKAFVDGRMAGATVRADYELQSAAPTIDPPTGTYTSSQTVTLSVSGPPATIRYTLDGCDPSAASTAYNAPFTINTMTTIKARAFPTNGWNPSSVTSAMLSFSFGTLNAPVAVPAGGAFQTAPQLTLTATASSTIHYTLDGTVPTEASTLYTGPFTLPTDGGELKAKAFHPDWISSPVMSEEYIVDGVVPTITATVRPSPNSAGWNNTPVTVTFACSDNNEGVNCPGPVSLESPGSGQQITGTATDAAGNSATASVTVAIDFTAPEMTRTSPADGLGTTSLSVDIAASASDSLSGISGALCNGQPASMNGSDVTCTVLLGPGKNWVVVQVVDYAGNTRSSGVRVTRIGTPTKLDITPAERTIVLGERQGLSLTDDFGAIVTGATWHSSDDAIVSLTSDDPPQVSAVAPGTVTVSATKNGLTAEAEVTVLVGTTVPDGMTRWSVLPTTTPGFGTLPLIYTNKVEANGPDIFGVEWNSVGNGAAKIRALSYAGEVLWTADVDGRPIFGDAFGGLLVQLGGSAFTALARVGGGANALPWRYESPGGFEQIVQAPDGTIYGLEVLVSTRSNTDGSEITDSQLIALDGNSGAVLWRVPLAREVIAYESKLNGYSSCNSTRREVRPETEGPIIGLDGNAYLLVREYTRLTAGLCNEQSSYPKEINRRLKLLRFGASGLLSSTEVFGEHCSVATSACYEAPSLHQVVPDLKGGSFVVWGYAPQSGSHETFVTRFLADGTRWT